MNYLEKSILKTVAYYDVLDWPLTGFEVWKYLVNPRRFAFNAPEHYSLGEVLDTLSQKPIMEYISERLGFYFLKDRNPDIVQNRISRELLADQKWRLIKRRVHWLQMIPYVRLVLVSGSLATGNVHDNSDADLLIITKAGRIWTCRLLVTLFLDILRWRRRSDHYTKNKLCLNHYITEHSLMIDAPSIYNAQTYSHLVPVLGNIPLWRTFQERNAWIKSYLAHFPPPFVPHTRRVTPSKILAKIAKLGETVLNTKMGERLEQFLGRLQAEKIAHNPKTGETGGRVLYSSDALEFHPDSKEKWIIARLNERLTELGFPDLADEKDSGLM